MGTAAADEPTTNSRTALSSPKRDTGFNLLLFLMLWGMVLTTNSPPSPFPQPQVNMQQKTMQACQQDASRKLLDRYLPRTAGAEGSDMSERTGPWLQDLGESRTVGVDPSTATSRWVFQQPPTSSHTWICNPLPNILIKLSHWFTVSHGCVDRAEVSVLPEVDHLQKLEAEEQVSQGAIHFFIFLSKHRNDVSRILKTFHMFVKVFSVWRVS